MFVFVPIIPKRWIKSVKSFNKINMLIFRTIEFRSNLLELTLYKYKMNPMSFEVVLLAVKSVVGRPSLNIILIDFKKSIATHIRR